MVPRFAFAARASFLVLVEQEVSVYTCTGLCGAGTHSTHFLRGSDEWTVSKIEQTINQTFDLRNSVADLMYSDPKSYVLRSAIEHAVVSVCSVPC
jgi:hypothetical protein